MHGFGILRHETGKRISPYWIEIFNGQVCFSDLCMIKIILIQWNNHLEKVFLEDSRLGRRIPVLVKKLKRIKANIRKWPTGEATPMLYKIPI